MDYTTNYFLLDMLSKFQWDHKFDVVASNELQTKISGNEDFTLICNLSRREEGGSHWISLIRRGDTIYKLDPLLLDFEINPDISSFIASKHVQTKTLRHPIQHPKSYYCGLFCLYFCLCFNKRVMDICHKFEPFKPMASMKNDCICLDNLSSIFSAAL